MAAPVLLIAHVEVLAQGVVGMTAESAMHSFPLLLLHSPEMVHASLQGNACAT
jgi:hypothetical protein